TSCELVRLLVDRDVLDVGVFVNVPCALLAVALFVMVSVFAPLVTLIEVVLSGGPEKVPVALDPVPSFVMASVFAPLVTLIEVLFNGAAEKVPRAWDCDPLFVKVNVFAPLVIVMAVCGEVSGGAEKVPTA